MRACILSRLISDNAAMRAGKFLPLNAQKFGACTLYLEHLSAKNGGKWWREPDSVARHSPLICMCLEHMGSSGGAMRDTVSLSCLYRVREGCVAAQAKGHVQGPQDKQAHDMHASARAHTYIKFCINGGGRGHVCS
jgi:hypothetical protein